MLHRLMTCWSGKNQFIIFNLTAEGQFSSKIRDLGIPVHDLNLFSKPWNIFKMIKILASEEVASLWGWMYHGNVIAFLLKTLIKPKASLVWNIRHSLYSLQQEKKITRLVIYLNKIFSISADRIIFNSELSLEQHRNYGFDANNLAYIPNGFDLKNFKHDLRTSQDTVTVGHVGRFHPMKNQKEMVKVFVELAKMQKNLKFLLVGKGMESQNSEITTLIPGDMMNRFTFLGEQTDVYKYYYQMDIFVLFSSWGEAFPNVLVEALLAGNIAISTDIGDAASIVGEADFIVPIGDTNLLKEKLLRFSNWSVSERQQKNKLLKERLIQNFSIENVANQFSKYLGNV